MEGVRVDEASGNAHRQAGRQRLKNEKQNVKPPMLHRINARQTPCSPFLLTAAFGLGLACVAALTASAQPTISTDPRSQFAWEGKRVSLNVTAKGAVPLSHQWQFNGIDITDATNRSLILAQVQLTNDGGYRVVVTDPNGSATSKVAQVLVRRWPQPTGPRIPQLARLDTNMQTVLLNYGIPGGSLAVVKDGRLVFARGYGWADVEHHEPFQPDSRCQIASLSKTIAAAVVMKLVEAGQLDLNARAFSLLDLEPAQYPGAVYDSRLTNITVRHLLSHSAGWNWDTATNPLGGTGFDAAFWPDWTMQDLGLSEPATPTEFVRWIMGKPLQKNPGSQTIYSNVGYIVAGRVIERITGQTFEMAARLLLAEAGITRVQLGRNSRAERRPGEVVYYLHPGVTEADIVGPGSWAQPRPMDSDLPYAYPITTIDAAGGFIASALDHARFVAAIDGLSSFPDLLTTNSVSAMVAGPLGWDYWGIQGTSPETGIWSKQGILFGATSRAVKWRSGVIFVFVLNSWARWDADPDLYNRLTASLATVSWPTNDLFAATLSLEAWRTKFFSALELADATVSGDQADPDGDGNPNLLEFGQGTNPRLANDPSKLTASLLTTNGLPAFVLSFRRLLLAHELDYRLEASADLQAWSPVSGQESEPALNLDGTITVSVNVGLLANSPARFVRLRISTKQ